MQGRSTAWYGMMDEMGGSSTYDRFSIFDSPITFPSSFFFSSFLFLHVSFFPPSQYPSLAFRFGES